MKYVRLIIHKNSHTKKNERKVSHVSLVEFLQNKTKTQIFFSRCE